MKVVGFAGSNSLESINKKLVNYTLSLFEGQETELLDLNDYEVEIYRPDRESENGIPSKITDFAAKISNADLLVVSLAEHNGSYSSAFKNIFDWMSRIPNRKIFDGKSMLLMASSPGPRGGATVLAAALDRFPRDGANILASFSLPSFNQNFDVEQNKISDSTMNEALTQIVEGILNNEQ